MMASKTSRGLRREAVSFDFLRCQERIALQMKLEGRNRIWDNKRLHMLFVKKIGIGCSHCKFSILYFFFLFYFINKKKFNEVECTYVSRQKLCQIQQLPKELEEYFLIGCIFVINFMIIFFFYFIKYCINWWILFIFGNWHWL